jgi:tRNA(Ile)-lysidine synthase
VETVGATVRRHGLLAPGEHVLAAASAGPDSTALLAALVALAAGGLDVRVTAAHLDHGIRGAEARADLASARELARSLGVPFVAGRADVPAEAAGSGRGLEETARTARYEFLERAARDVGADAVATGHTADDQAETVLMRIVRGTGLKGLAGIRYARALGAGLRVVRPLLDVRRADVVTFLDAAGLAWREDSTNLDMDQSRARVRHKVLPGLERDFGFDVSGSLVRLARIAAGNRRCVEGVVKRAVKSLVAHRGEGETELRLDRVRALDPYVRAETLGHVLRALGSQGHGADAIDRIEELIGVEAGGSRLAELGGGFEALAEYDRLVLRRAGGAAGTGGEAGRSGVVRVPVPGSALVPGTGRTVEASGPHAGRPSADLTRRDPQRECVDAEKLALPLEARAAAPGDRFSPLGLKGTKKLQDFFVDRKVPRRRRWRTPVVADGRGIVWVAGHRIDARVRITSGTRRWIELVVAEEGQGT